MAQNEHRRFQPTAPVTMLDGNAWETWRDPQRAPEPLRLTTSVDWLEGELGSYAPDDSRS